MYQNVIFRLVKRVDLNENEFKVDHEHEIFFYQVEDEILDQMGNEPPLEIKPLLETSPRPYFHTTVYLFLDATRWSHYGYW